MSKSGMVLFRDAKIERKAEKLHKIDCFALLITSRRVFFVRAGDLD